MGVAIPGVAIPFSRPIRSSALAIVAPVLPAETIAEASPSRTASAARTSEESFFLPDRGPGSSSISMTSDASITGRSEGVADPVGGADEHDGDPERVTGLARPGDDLARCLVAPHRVDRHRKAGGEAPRRCH